MKKIYMTPETLVAQLNTGLTILTASPRGGVKTGDNPGDEYEEDDISYSRRRRRNQWDEWEDEEEEYY